MGAAGSLKPLDEHGLLGLAPQTVSETTTLWLYEGSYVHYMQPDRTLFNHIEFTMPPEHARRMDRSGDEDKLSDADWKMFHSVRSVRIDALALWGVRDSVIWGHFLSLFQHCRNIQNVTLYTTDRGGLYDEGPQCKGALLRILPHVTSGKLSVLSLPMFMSEQLASVLCPFLKRVPLLSELVFPLWTIIDTNNAYTQHNCFAPHATALALGIIDIPTIPFQSGDSRHRMQELLSQIIQDDAVRLLSFETGWASPHDTDINLPVVWKHSSHHGRAVHVIVRHVPREVDRFRNLIHGYGTITVLLGFVVQNTVPQLAALIATIWAERERDDAVARIAVHCSPSVFLPSRHILEFFALLVSNLNARPLPAGLHLLMDFGYRTWDWSNSMPLEKETLRQFLQHQIGADDWIAQNVTFVWPSNAVQEVRERETFLAHQRGFAWPYDSPEELHTVQLGVDTTSQAAARTRKSAVRSPWRWYPTPVELLSREDRTLALTYVAPFSHQFQSQRRETEVQIVFYADTYRTKFQQICQLYMNDRVTSVILRTGFGLQKLIPVAGAQRPRDRAA